MQLGMVLVKKCAKYNWINETKEEEDAARQLVCNVNCTKSSHVMESQVVLDVTTTVFNESDR